MQEPLELVVKSARMPTTTTRKLLLMKTTKCQLCKGSHWFTRWLDFKRLTVGQRRYFVQRKISARIAFNLAIKSKTSAIILISETFINLA